MARGQDPASWRSEEEAHSSKGSSHLPTPDCTMSGTRRRSNGNGVNGAGPSKRTTPANGRSDEKKSANGSHSTSRRRSRLNAFKYQSQTEKANYRWTASLEEVKDGRTQSWAVQFCLRPSGYHYLGPGRCWDQRRREREANRLNLHTAPAPSTVADLSPDELDLPQNLPAGRAWRYMFATSNQNCIRVYDTAMRQTPRLVAEFKDEDINEEYYCVAWVFNADGKEKWWLVAGGKNAVIRVIDVQSGRLLDSLPGHGDGVYDLKVHPRDPALIVSASNDNSLQLWNLRTGGKIAMFLGHKGHRDAVLSVDFDRCGHRMVSSSIDFSVRIWEITDDDDVLNAILESHKAADRGVSDRYIYVDERGEHKRLRIATIQTPVYTNSKVHKHYIDCVMWVGECILSKSIDNRMYLWMPGADRESLGKANKNWEFTLLEEYPVTGCDMWFIRFALDRDRKIVACGGESVSLLCSFPLSFLLPLCIL